MSSTTTDAFLICDDSLQEPFFWWYKLSGVSSSQVLQLPLCWSTTLAVSGFFLRFLLGNIRVFGWIQVTEPILPPHREEWVEHMSPLLYRAKWYKAQFALKSIDAAKLKVGLSYAILYCRWGRHILLPLISQANCFTTNGKASYIRPPWCFLGVFW